MPHTGSSASASAAAPALQASSAAECRRLLIARARLLQRFGRYGYFRVLLEAKDLPAFLASIERLDSLLEGSA